MMPSRSSRPRLLAATALLTTLVLLPGAYAQFDPTTVPEGTPTAPSDTESAIDEEVLRAPAAPRGTGVGPEANVYQQGLDSLDPSSPGTLTPADGGFPPDMWKGTSRHTLTALLPRLPLPASSPAMRSLGDRLLLSEAYVPEARVTEDSSDGEAGQDDAYDVLGARVERLAAAGRADEIADLFSRTPGKIQNLALTRQRVDALLVTGDLVGACDEALSANQRADGPGWLPIVAFCKATAGDRSGAVLATDMLRELGQEDEAYFTLASWLNQPEDARGDPPEIADAGKLTPLKLAMMREAGVEIPAEALETAPPMVLTAIARDEERPAALRIAAAQRAAKAGAADGALLAKVYALAEPDPTALEDPLAAVADMESGQAYALLYKAAIEAPDDVARLAILKEVWKRAEADGLYLTEARANAEATVLLDPAPPPPAPPVEAEAPTGQEPAAEEAAAAMESEAIPGESEPEAQADVPLGPPPELIAAAPQVVRALAAAGEGDAARRWYDVLGERAAEAAAGSEDGGQAGGDDDMATADAGSTQPEAAAENTVLSDGPGIAALRTRIWLYVLIADPGLKCDEEDIARWVDWSAEAGAGDRAVMFAVLDGFGCAVPEVFLDSLFAQADRADYSMPSFAVWRALNASARQGQLGRTVLLSLVALGEGGPPNASPAVLSDVITDLRKVGLDDDARAIAIEAMAGSRL
jgi:hypothetical protein